jgi:hypothetical protein
MNSNPRYLTKSRFKLACNCPTKVYYSGKKDYPDQKQNNDFLQQLADGGYQVGKLAEYKFPGGVGIETLSYDEAIKLTNEALTQDKCIIYEAAFKYQNLFIRADVIVKNGNHIELYEVKAKSYSEDDLEFTGKKNESINSAWKEYIYDVAFQKYVVTKAFPDSHVNAYLTLINKDHACTIEGLHQNFKINKEELKRINSQGEEEIRIKRFISVKDGLKASELDTDILINKNVDEVIRKIWEGEFKIDFNQLNLNEKTFEEAVKFLAENYNSDKKLKPQVASRCGKCEFKAKDNDLENGKKDGMHECLREAWAVSENDLKHATIFELWKGQMGNGAGQKIKNWLDERKYWLKDLNREDVAPKKDLESARGLSPTDRRELQIDYNKNERQDSYIDKEGLKEEFAQFEYPLHFIDFETIGTAIPFHKGRRPYEAIAFQFSHHTVSETGEVIHANEWINIEQGAFPNFNFLRALKDAVGTKGTIFRYSHHENSILNSIKQQLGNSKETDKEELIEFIQLITQEKDENKKSIAGERNMVDLLELLKKYYYHPMMKGSNSIKVVLPAVLNDSAFLKEKYSEANYLGRNFKNKQWFVIDEKTNLAKDPYKLLPPIENSMGVFEIDDDAEEDFSDGKQINSGGPAMMAYAEMQFSETTIEKQQAIKNALLRYCELDTLAMVMIWEHWRSLLEE